MLSVTYRGFITLLVLCFSSAVFASEEDWVVRGMIFDDETRKPIPGANVYIVDFPSLTATSNKDGLFHVNIPEKGEYELGVFAFGYVRFKPQSFYIGNKTNTPTVTVRLLPTISKMPPIVITASREDKQAEVVKISGKDLSSVAGTGGDPVRGLRYLPGVAVQYDFSAEPAIRGSSPTDNIYYIDFIPTPQLFHADGAVSVLPDDLVTEFDLRTTAFEAGFDDVTGAVINIKLRNPNKEKSNRIIDLKATQIGLLTEGPVSDKQSYLLYARQSYLDLIVDKVSLDSTNVETSTPVFSDYLLKYLWEASGTNNFTLQIRGAYDQIGFDILPDSDFALQQPELVGETKIDSSTSAQSLVWSYTPNKTTLNKLAFGQYRTKRTSKYAAAINEQSITTSSFVRNQLDFVSSFSHSTTITWSAERKTISINSDSLNANCTSFDVICDLSSANRLQLADKFNLDTSAIGISHLWKINMKSRATFGLRASNDNYLDAQFLEPRLELRHKTSRHTEWSFGYGEHHQQPSIEFIIPQLGNPELKPVESKHSFLGFRNIFAEKWSFKSELYYKTFDQVVISDPTLNFRNGGSGTSTGLEILLRRRSSEKLSGWISVAASRSEQTNEKTQQTFPFNFDQPLTASLVANYNFYNRWNFGLQWQYHSGQPFTPVTATNIVNGVPISTYGDINSERLPAYHRLDLRIEYKSADKERATTTFFEIINAYNRKNVAGYNYGKYFRKQSPIKQLPIFISFGIKTAF